MSKVGKNGMYLACCERCAFQAAGAEAFVRRKGSLHAKELNHTITIKRRTQQ